MKASALVYTIFNGPFASLDTLDPLVFEIMTRRRGHDAVLRSLEQSLKSNLQSVKLNVVVIKGLNDGEILDFVEMTRDRKVSVRFIEFMPFTGEQHGTSPCNNCPSLGTTGNKWDKSKMVPSSELLERIVTHHPRATKAADEENDTARSYRIPGFQGSFGMSHICMA
jgi:cyclic pyranopterin phosphate synthase